MSATTIISYILQFFAFAILIRAIMSWFMMNPSTRGGILFSIYQFFHYITEPIMAPLRRIIPTIGMVDITPMIAFILLQLIAFALTSV
jgi:YggT family protein